MASFPEFRNPQTPGGIQAFGLNQKVLDISPLLQSVQQKNARQKARPKGVGDKDKKDDLLTGRVGAVNQYYQAINSVTKKIVAGENKWGDMYHLMPEYSKNKNLLNYYTSPEFQNIVSEETKNVEAFEKNVQQANAGEQYHVGQFLATDGGDTATLAQLVKRQNMGYTTQLPFPKSGQKIDANGNSDIVEMYDHDLNMNPNFYTRKDAQDEMDQIFNPGDNQYVEKATSVITAKIVQGAGFDAEGIHKFKDKKSNDKRALGFAAGEASDRLLSNGYDKTDPLIAGYMQAFLQKTKGFYGEYNGKNARLDNGNIDRAVFGQAFHDYVKADIGKHYNKRVTELESEDQTMKENSEYAYGAGANNKDTNEILSGGTTKPVLLVMQDEETYRVAVSPEKIEEAQKLADKHGLGNVIDGPNAMFKKIIDKDGKEKIVSAYGSRFKPEGESGEVDPNNPFTNTINKINSLTELPDSYWEDQKISTSATKPTGAEAEDLLFEYKANTISEVAGFAKDMYDMYQKGMTKTVNTLNTYNETTYQMTAGVTDKINKSFGKGDKKTHELFQNTAVSITPGSQSDGGALLKGTNFRGVSGTTTLKLRYMPNNWTMINDEVGFFKTTGFVDMLDEDGKQVIGDDGNVKQVPGQTSKAGYTSSDKAGFLLRPHSEETIDAQNAWNAKNPNNDDIAGTTVAGYYQEGQAEVDNYKTWSKQLGKAKYYGAKKTFAPETVQENTKLITKVLNSNNIYEENKEKKRYEDNIEMKYRGSYPGSRIGEGKPPIETMTDKEYENTYDMSKTEARKIIDIAAKNGNDFAKTVDRHIKNRYLNDNVTPADFEKHAERKNVMKFGSVSEADFIAHIENGTLDQIMDKSTADFMDFKIIERDKVKKIRFTFQADITRMYDQAGINNKKTKRSFLNNQINQSKDWGKVDLSNAQQNAALDEDIKLFK